MLDRQEAHRLLGLICCPAVRMCATLMYSCGLRISEALALQVRDSQEGRWLSARKDYLVPVDALSLIFRGMFLEMAHKALPRANLSGVARTKQWVVYCKPTVQGTERVLQYLGRYVHRIALANSRLVRIEADQVTFRYQDHGKRQWRTMTLPALEFIRRFLQHVLPQGTHKVRYYGFWSPSHRQLLRRIQLVTGTSLIPTATEEEVNHQTDEVGAGSTESPKTCPCCRKGILVLKVPAIHLFRRD